MFILAPSAIMTICMLAGILFGMFVQLPVSEDEFSENIACVDNEQNPLVKQTPLDDDCCSYYRFYNSSERDVRLQLHGFYNWQIDTLLSVLFMPRYANVIHRCMVMSYVFFRPPPFRT
ncbi:MAG: hypothetical protein ACK5L5_02475 [Bacteroidales bacterium]